MPCKKLVIVGVSTGGPRALRQLFTGMPRLEAGIILVQHMPKFINDSFQRTLDALTEMDVVIAQDGSRIDAGTVYLAPSDVHLELINNQRIRLADGPKVCFVKPSIDVTMLSARHRDDQELAAVVLTGMGRDGADGIRHIKRIGGVTFAQDARSCAVYGMPKAAAETGAVDFVLSPEGIRDHLIEWAETAPRADQARLCQTQPPAIGLRRVAVEGNVGAGAGVALRGYCGAHVGPSDKRESQA